jgi:hypothetical protein
MTLKEDRHLHFKALEMLQYYRSLPTAPSKSKYLMMRRIAKLDQIVKSYLKTLKIL